MKNKVPKIIRTILFCVIALAILFVVCLVIIPKWRATKWIPADSIQSFYNTPKNSMDVIFYGSSAMGSSVSPYLLYEEQGLSSFNLALQSQNLFCSYMWLKESLNYQQPKLVVLDVKELCRVSETREEMIRRSYEYMRLGQPKLEFAITHCEKSPDAELVNYIFPIQIYHTRWNELNKNDFMFVAGENIDFARGFNMLRNREDKIDLPGLLGNGDPSGEKYLDSEREYLEKYIALCKEKGIDVLLIKSVDSTWTEDLHAYASRVAAENGVPFLDFNRKELLNEIGFNSKTDLEDDVHMNISGGEKLTHYLGEYIKKNYEISDCRKGDTPAKRVFEEGMEKYLAARTDRWLSLEFDFTSWLTMILENKDMYNVLLAAPAGQFRISEAQAKLLDQIGFPPELSAKLLNGEKEFCVAMAGEKNRYRAPKPEQEIVKLQKKYADDTVAEAKAERENAIVAINNKKQKKSDSAIVMAVYNRVTGQVADSIMLEKDDNGAVVLKR